MSKSKSKSQIRPFLDGIRPSVDGNRADKKDVKFSP